MGLSGKSFFEWEQEESEAPKAAGVEPEELTRRELKPPTISTKSPKGDSDFLGQDSFGGGM